MTYLYCKRIIQNGMAAGTLNVADMQQKLDVFLLNNRITQEQYNELTGMMTV